MCWISAVADLLGTWLGEGKKGRLREMRYASGLVFTVHKSPLSWIVLRAAALVELCAADFARCVWPFDWACRLRWVSDKACSHGRDVEKIEPLRSYLVCSICTLVMERTFIFSVMLAVAHLKMTVSVSRGILNPCRHVSARILFERCACLLWRGRRCVKDGGWMMDKGSTVWRCRTASIKLLL